MASSGNYDLIALDMDGTVLNGRKEITRGVHEAICQALDAGKEVVFCTGRAHAEMQGFLKRFPGMHYLIAESGAYLYDLRENRILHQSVIGWEDLEKLFRAIAGRDVMPVAFSNGAFVANAAQIGRMAFYGMEEYAEESPKIAHLTEDLREQILEKGLPVEKLNLLHTSTREREITVQKLEELRPEVIRVYSEKTLLECSPPGTHKGAALQILSGLCQIPRERMIMVGDSDNDLTALAFAGLAVAMGNANDAVRSACDVTVADNRHDGCAQAITQYLLAAG